MHNRQGRIKVTVTNTGSTAWPTGTSLSYRLFDSAQSERGGYGPFTTLDGLGAGGSRTLDAAVGPVSPGSWFILWDINVPGVGWLGPRGVCPLTSLEVGNQRPSISLVSPRLADAVTTRTPYLTVTGSDVDSWPSPSALTYDFRVCSNVELTIGCRTSGPTRTSSWRVPDGALDWTGTYYWNATVSDGQASVSLRDGGDNPSLLRFQVVVPQPDTWRQVGNGLGLTNVHGLLLPYGVFVHTERDVELKTENLPLSVDRTYSSGARNTEGVFGRGWISALDARAVRDSSNGQITITYPDGRQETFAPSGSGYVGAAHLGMRNVLVRNPDSSIRVAQSNGEVVDFDAGGAIRRIEFPGAGSWEFGYAADLVRTVTQKPSGKQIKIDWGRPPSSSCIEGNIPTRPYVMSVSVEREGEARSIWQYSYSCDRLVSVRDPMQGVKKYGWSTSTIGMTVTTAEGRVLPGLSSASSWRNIGTTHRERTFTLTEPGSAPRTIRLLAPPATGSTTWYRDSYNAFGGLTALYCESRQVSGSSEQCNGYFDTLQFDLEGRLRYSFKGVETADLLSTPHRYWYYDASGRLQAVIDENSNTKDFYYDAYGNMTTALTYRQTSDALNARSTSYYKDVSPNPQMPIIRLAGVSTAPDSSLTPLANYVDMFHYDTAGRLIRRDGPPTPGSPSGEDVDYSYTTGQEQAVNVVGAPIAGKTMPAGLLRTETTAAGTTTYSYDEFGNATRTSDRRGLVTSRAYDARGLVTIERTGGIGVTPTQTTFAYDDAGRMTREARPCTSDWLSGEDFQLVIEYQYDRDGLLVAETRRALNCSTLAEVEPARTTSFTYTARGQLSTETSPSGAITSYTYSTEDPMRVSSMKDARGRLTNYTYTNKGQLRQILADVGAVGSGQRAALMEYGYDRAGRIDYDYDAAGRITYYEYTGDDLAFRARRPIGVAPGGASILTTLWQRSFDGVGRVTRETVGGRVVLSQYDAEGRLAATVVDPAGLNRISTTLRDAAGRVVEMRLSDSSRTERVTYDVDASGDPVATRQWLDDIASLKTVTDRNVRGQITATKDPRHLEQGTAVGDYTRRSYFDANGRVVHSSGPMIVVDAPTNANAADSSAFRGATQRREADSSDIAYNAFGDVTSIADRHGVTKYDYDAAGRMVREHLPSYTRLDGSEVHPVIQYSYNAAGDLVTKIDARGGVTDYEYDVAGNLVRETAPEVAWLVRPSTVYTYDSAGQLTSSTSPTGATTSYAYDRLGRVVAVSARERVGTSSYNFVTSFAYNAAGDLISVTTPAGRVTRYDRNAAGEATAIWHPGRTRPDRFEYDVAGRITRATDGAGRAVESVYDLAGRKTSTTRVGTDGSRLTSTYEYDLAGNLIAFTNPRGARTSYSVNALNLRTSITQPVAVGKTITMRAGYDARGNRVRTTDGNGTDTWTLYDSWDRPALQVEAATRTHPNLSERSWRFEYDASGNQTREERPGAIRVTREFDRFNRLVRESAASQLSDGPRPAERSFEYDLDGRLTAARNATGDVTLAWTDRGLLKSSRDPQGRSMSFGYTADSQLSSRASDIRFETFSYDEGGRLATFQGGPLGPIGWKYDTASGAESARFTDTVEIGRTYDPHGRLEGVETADWSARRSLEKTEYHYDSNDNVVESSISGMSGGGAYEYDLADRLVRWKPGNGNGATGSWYEREYQWDDAGNLDQQWVNVTQQDLARDERGRIMAVVEDFDYGPPEVTSVNVDASGNVTKVERVRNGEVLDTRILEYDALGQLVSDDGVAYSYDALGRLTSAGGEQGLFWYADLDSDPERIAAVGLDDAEEVFRAPDGTPLASLGAYGARVLVPNQHGDITGGVPRGVDPTMSSRVQREPFGASFAETDWALGTETQPSALGLQADWTNMASSTTWMGARWYDAGLRAFLSRDSTVFPFDGFSSLNRYAYGASNPITFTDSTGRFVDQLWREVERGVGDIARNVQRTASDFWTPERRAVLDALGREFVGESGEAAARKIGGRAASRLIPGLGWVLVAADVITALSIIFALPTSPPGGGGGGGPGGGGGGGAGTGGGGNGPATGTGGGGGAATTPGGNGAPPPRPADPTVQFDRWGAKVSSGNDGSIAGVVSLPAADQAGSTLPPCGLANTISTCLAPTAGVVRACASRASAIALCLPMEPVAGAPGASGVSQNVGESRRSRPMPAVPGTQTGGASGSGGGDDFGGVELPDCDETEGYRSFPAAKRDLGAAGPGMDWDHVVEQSQIRRSGFSAEQINDPCNMIAVPSHINNKRAAYYNSFDADLKPGVRVRDWLAGQSFEFQRQFGIDKLNVLLRGEELR